MSDTSVEASRLVRLRNPAGLHARPCHKIVTVANRYESEFRVSNDEFEVNGKSILELMTLCAPVESVLRLWARGRDAALLVDDVAKVVDSGFDELEG